METNETLTAYKTHDIRWSEITRARDIARRSLDAKIMDAASLLWGFRDDPCTARSRTGRRVVVSPLKAIGIFEARIAGLTNEQLRNVSSGHSRPGVRYGDLSRSYFYDRGDGIRAQLIEDTVDRVTAAYAEAAAAEAALEEHEAQYTGWNRYFLCLSPKGHVHSSWSCKSLRPSSPLALLDVLSGETVETLLAEVGGGLCTHCYKDAPVEHTGFVGTKKGGEIAARYTTAKKEASA
jgi:hypothetical protein